MFCFHNDILPSFVFKFALLCVPVHGVDLMRVLWLLSDLQCDYFRVCDARVRKSDGRWVDKALAKH